MKVHELVRSAEVPRPHAEVFAFFSDATNLALLTPRSLRLEILSPLPITMRVGTRIDYRVRIRGLPLRWTSEITRWDPPHAFTDEQVRGPYRLWVHEHEFEATARGTLVRDRVRYAVHGGRLVDRLVVRPDLERIFAHRAAAMLQLLG